MVCSELVGGVPLAQIQYAKSHVRLELVQGQAGPGQPVFSRQFRPLHVVQLVLSTAGKDPVERRLIEPDADFIAAAKGEKFQLAGSGIPVGQAEIAVGCAGQDGKFLFALVDPEHEVSGDIIPRETDAKLAGNQHPASPALKL